MTAGPAPSATSSSTMSNEPPSAWSSASPPLPTAVIKWPSRVKDRESISRSGASSSTSRMSSVPPESMRPGR
jgi:hypothetical protein